MNKFSNERIFAEYIASLGGILYRVGGSVRDELMTGTVPHDHDYAVQGLNLLPFKSVGMDFPVYLVQIGEGLPSEVALCRVERKVGTGYTGFTVETAGVTIEQDLSRRDLTMNAIAINVLTNATTDPFGGIDDINQRIIRHTSDAFTEDPLRILRTARFAARFPHFQITPSTYEMMKSLVHELVFISPERIAIELMKVSNAHEPRRFFDVLNTVGALDLLFPEIAALQVPDKHDGTAYNHVMELLKHADDENEFIGLLMHDLGKGATDPAMHPSHHGHDELGMEIAKNMGRRLRFSKNQIRFAVASSETHMKLKNFMTMRPAKQLRMILKYNDILNDLVTVSLKDSIRRDGVSMADATRIRSEFLKTKDRITQIRTIIKIIDGNLLKTFGVQPDKNFGQKLEQARILALKKI